MLSSKIKKMFAGLDLDPEEIIALEGRELDSERLSELNSPFPSLNRYRKFIHFLENITSLRALYRYRLKVIVEYFIALSETMGSYSGKFQGQKILPCPLEESEKKILRSLSEQLTPQQIAQIEAIEQKSDHDTAAITDWIKFTVDHQKIFRSLEKDRDKGENMLDGFHFGRTSEDVNSPAFALMNRDLFFGHIIPEIIALQDIFVDFANQHDTIIAALTHGQPAEPSTLAKQIMNTVSAIDSVLRHVFLPFNNTGQRSCVSFPVKTFGAIGNHNDLIAAYPDIDWIENDRRFISALGPGLHLDLMVNQALLYGEYKIIYDAVATISRHLIKFCRDFWGWTSFQWFKKRKKKGVKGSSVMPNKYNPWRIEGAIRILEKAIVQLEFSSRALIDYPYEGDMGRSIIMRDIGDDFAKFFIALGRIREELSLYEVNQEKVTTFLEENPGLVGGAAQTTLKRSANSTDAYRKMQQIMIKEDGSYCSAAEFQQKLSEQTDLEQESRQEILLLADPSKNVGYAYRLTELAKQQVKETKALACAVGYKIK